MRTVQISIRFATTGGGAEVHIHNKLFQIQWREGKITIQIQIQVERPGHVVRKTNNKKTTNANRSNVQNAKVRFRKVGDPEKRCAAQLLVVAASSSGQAGN